MLTTLLMLALGTAHAGGDEPAETDTRYVFSVEPIKLSSLMLNMHPDWSAFGLEAGVRVHERVWLQAFVEIDKGSLHQDFLAPNKDFLTNHHYTAMMFTGRWMAQPDARKSALLEGGVAIQWLWQQYIDRGGSFESRTGMAFGPVLLGGYEWHMGRSNAFFKVRGGGGWNAHRQGGVTGHLDLKDHDELARSYYSPYTHLTEVLFQPFFYIGDVAIGFKF